jgi:indolepyruvate ferredoxin oxidoreductase
MLKAFGVLAKLKFLRGTALDPFGRTAERKIERRLIGEYETVMEELLARLDHDNHALAMQIASLPEEIRGYGHIKDANLAKAKKKEAELLSTFRAPQVKRTAAE